MGSGTRRPVRLTQPPWPAILISTTLLVDVLAVTGGYVLARAIVHDPSFGAVPRAMAPSFFASVAIWPVVFAIFGLYQPRRLLHSHLEELQRLIAASVTAAAVFVGVAFVVRMEVARDLVPALLLSCLANVVVGRVITRLLALAVDE